MVNIVRTPPVKLAPTITIGEVSDSYKRPTLLGTLYVYTYDYLKLFLLGNNKRHVVTRKESMWTGKVGVNDPLDKKKAVVFAIVDPSLRLLKTDRWL